MICSSGGTARVIPLAKKAGEIALLARVVAVAEVLEIVFTRYGRDAVVEIARKRSGGRFDPGLVATFCNDAGDLLAGLGAASAWDTFLDTEPAPRRNVTPRRAHLHQDRRNEPGRCCSVRR